jgi:hypothetical protein
MQWFRFRPTFEVPLEDPRDVAMEKLQREYLRLAERDRFAMYGEYGEIHLPPSEHRLWSPHLSFYVTQRDHDCIIHGRFAPRLDVWTSVWIAYLAMVFSAFFGSMLAYSQWMLGESMWGLGVVATSLLIVLTLYVVAHIGQQLSADQMEQLRNQLQEILRDAGLAPIAS